MKLTIAICMYNSCANVKRLLDKLFEQAEDDDLEVIVLDDGSTESVHEVTEACRRYHFRYLWQHNQGEATARQRSLDEATGDFFTWIDADDDIKPEYLRTVKAEIALYNADIIMHRWHFIHGGEGDQHPKPLANWNVWANVYRREVVKDIKFDLDRQYSSDYFWLEDVVKTKNPTIYYSDKSINIYNDQNQNSLTRRFQRGEIKARFSEE